MKYAFAHRGGSAHGHDNTIATFVEALARGATGLETDAWVTADGVVVLDHDGVVRTTSGRRSAIADVGRDQLPAHIPTLDDLYAECGTDFDLAIDVKDAGVAELVAETAARHDVANRLWLFAHDGVALGDIGDAHAAVTLRGTELLIGNRSRRLEAESDRGIKAINARWMWWTSCSVQTVHSLGMLAFGYDAQRHQSIRRCVDVGLDGIFSDHVDRMTAVFDKP